MPGFDALIDVGIKKVSAKEKFTIRKKEIRINMKKTIFSHLVILVCCIALLTFVSVTHTFGQSSPVISIQRVTLFSSTTVVPTGGSMLARNNDGIYMNYNTAGLVSGTVATFWLAIFNTPAGCAVPNACTPADLTNTNAHGSLVYGGGKIIGADGSATFGGFRAVGDTTGIERGFAGALVLPLTADIHLVVRTHGAASSDPAVLTQQLTTFNGGCPPNTCANIQQSLHE